MFFVEKLVLYVSDTPLCPRDRDLKNACDISRRYRQIVSAWMLSNFYCEQHTVPPIARRVYSIEYKQKKKNIWKISLTKLKLKAIKMYATLAFCKNTAVYTIRVL